MDKATVLVFHGMGEHPTGGGWEKEWMEPLDEMTENLQLDALEQGKFSDYVTFTPISYDHNFSKLVTSWKNTASKASDTMTGAQAASFEKVFDAVKNMEEESSSGAKKFFRTHIIDVLLWRYSQSIRNGVINDVAVQMIDAIDNAGNKNKVHAIAHSLGTSVLNGTGHAIATGGWKSDKAKFFVKNKHFLLSSIHTFANVSRMLAPKKSRPYDETMLRPKYIGTDGGWCRNFYNYRHPVDPFTWLKPFEAEQFKQKGKDIEVPGTHIRDLNIHGFEHFIKHPNVIKGLFRGLGLPALSPQDSDKLDTWYLEQIIPDEIMEFKDKLKQLQNVVSLGDAEGNDDDDLITFLETIVELQKIVPQIFS
ncbi:MAG: hypothetical protein HQL69_02895 [Magnetococcales bacterium]|nr:hypothetical protein [Magnetococcales bacterium]